MSQPKLFGFFFCLPQVVDVLSASVVNFFMTLIQTKRKVGLRRPLRNTVKDALGKTDGFIFSYVSFFLICPISTVKFIDYGLNSVLTSQIFPVGANCVETE